MLRFDPHVGAVRKAEMLLWGCTFLLLAGRAVAETDATAKGGKVYGRYCVSCHGPLGDGEGYAAQHLDPRPRNFTAGKFKWRSTPSGELPRDEDLLRTVTEGIYGTAMPSWYALSPTERRDVISYIKTFSPRFAHQRPTEPLRIPRQPPMTPESITAGAQVYERTQCAQCHGTGGRGDGPASTTLLDDWGRPIRAYDLTRGQLKCGGAPEDIYRVFMTGLNGAPMPSFADSLTPEEAWPLVHFIVSLRRPEGRRP